MKIQTKVIVSVEYFPVVCLLCFLTFESVDEFLYKTDHLNETYGFFKLFLLALQCISTWMRGNFGLKHIHLGIP